MGWTRTQIANLGLRACGFKGSIVDVDSDTTAQARIVRDVLDLAIEHLMSAYDWPHARRHVELSLVGGTSSSAWNDDFQYAYRYSTTWMKFIRVVDEDGGDRNPTDESNIPYRIDSDSSGRLVLTDLEDAEAEVIILPDEGQYPASFVEALRLKVGMMAGPSLWGDTKKAIDLSREYESAVAEARVFAANEGQYELRPDTPSIRARRGNLRTDRTWRAE